MQTTDCDTRHHIIMRQSMPVLSTTAYAEEQEERSHEENTV